MAGVAAFLSLPASAHGGYHYAPRPYVSFGYGYGYPFGFYPSYYPYGGYSPWGFGPSIGVGVRVGRSHSRRDRDERDEQGDDSRQALKMYVYPAAGQTEKQTSDDRYQCHVWAVDKSGYDPTLGAGKREDAEGYSRAFTACMEGRNYVVK